MTSANTVYSPSQRVDLSLWLGLSPSVMHPMGHYHCAKLPLWLCCSRGAKCCKLNFCGQMSHSPVCKNPFCKWNLLSVHPATRYEFEFKYILWGIFLNLNKRDSSHIHRVHCGKICCESLGRPKIDNVSMPRGRESWAVQCHFPLIRDKEWAGCTRARGPCLSEIRGKQIGREPLWSDWQLDTGWRGKRDESTIF